MEYIDFRITDPSKIECNRISRKEFIMRKLSDYNEMTTPVKAGHTTYKSVITFRYYFELQDKYFEILSVTHVLINSQNGRMVFHSGNAEAVKCVTEILTEIDLLINQFCSHIMEIKDKIKYLSTAEIYSLALVVLGSFLFKGEN